MLVQPCIKRACLFTPPVGYSGPLSNVNETNCNKKRSEQKNMSSLPTPFRCVPPRGNERWRSNLRSKLLVLVVFVSADLDGWALQLALLIRGVSGFASRQRLCNQIEGA